MKLGLVLVGSALVAALVSELPVATAETQRGLYQESIGVHGGTFTRVRDTVDGNVCYVMIGMRVGGLEPPRLEMVCMAQR